MEVHVEPEEPDPEFINKLAAFHAERGSVFIIWTPCVSFTKADVD